MRRKDREITTQKDMIAIMQKCDVCHLAFAANNIPYIVPMNFGFEVINEQFVLYFHCAKQGKKLDMLAKNPNVCFEMDCCHQLVEGVAACDYSMEYASVIGNGKIEVLDNLSEKRNALTAIMHQYSDKNDFTFPDTAIDAVCVLKLQIDSLTGKRKEHK